MNKKVGVVFVFSLVLLLSVGFVSAGPFDFLKDFWGKITGKVVLNDYDSCSDCLSAGNVWCEDGSGDYENVCLDSDPQDYCGAGGGDLITDVGRCAVDVTEQDRADVLKTCEQCTNQGYYWCSNSGDVYENTCLSSNNQGDCASGELIKSNFLCPQKDIVAEKISPEELITCDSCVLGGYDWCLDQSETFGTCVTKGTCESSGGISVTDYRSCTAQISTVITEQDRADFLKTCEQCVNQGYYWCSNSGDVYSETCLSSNNQGDCASGELIKNGGGLPYIS